MVPAAPHGSMQVCHRSQLLCDGLSALHEDAILAVLLAHSLRDQSHVVLPDTLQAPVVMRNCSVMSACSVRVCRCNH